jgi:CBS domain-containing protein
MNVDALYSSLTVYAVADESLSLAASRMRFNDVGSAVILDDGRLAGIITERDLARAVADGADPRKVTVGDYMTPDPAVVPPTTDIREAARIMTDGGFRHLPVVTDGVFLGLVSMRDIGGEILWTSNNHA